jgi:hypothetical protein
MFAPESKVLDIRGTAVTVRSMTTAEVFAQYAAGRDGKPEVEKTTAMLLACCTGPDGKPLFADAAAVAACDCKIALQLLNTIRGLSDVGDHPTT